MKFCNSSIFLSQHLVLCYHPIFAKTVTKLSTKDNISSLVLYGRQRRKEQGTTLQFEWVHKGSHAFAAFTWYRPVQIPDLDVSFTANGS